MYVKAIIILCVAAIVLLIILFSRGSSNGTRVSNDNDSVDKLRSGTKSARVINNKLGNNTKERQILTGKLKQNNRKAGTGINKAINILKKAKDRSNTDKDI
jgi:hypothetical protein